jgi:hypothetical protein
MNPALPVAPNQIKATLKIGDIRFDRAAPFLQPGFHILAADLILKASNDFVEYDIFDLQTFGKIQIVQTRISAICGTIPGNRSIVFYYPVNYALEKGLVSGISLQYLAIQYQIARPGCQRYLMAKLNLPLAFDDNVRMLLID